MSIEKHIPHKTSLLETILIVLLFYLVHFWRPQRNFLLTDIAVDFFFIFLIFYSLDPNQKHAVQKEFIHGHQEKKQVAQGQRSLT